MPVSNFTDDDLFNARGEYLTAKMTGEQQEVVVDGNGRTKYQPVNYVDIAEEDQLNPFAIQGEVTPRSPTEFIGDVGAGTAGVVTGAASITAGLPGDLSGLIKGASAAFQADDGAGVEAFLETLAAESESWGSEFFVEKFEALADEMLPPDQAEVFKASSDYVGQMAEIPGAITGIAKGIIKMNRYANEAAGPTSKAIPTQPKVDVEATPVDTKLIFETLPQRTNIADLTPEQRKALETDLKTSQLDIGSTAKEFVQAAIANQKALVKTGKGIREEVDVSKYFGEIEFKDPKVKGAKDKGKRMGEKSAIKGGIHQLTDINRAGFAVVDTDQADALVDALATKYKIVDEGYTVTPLGYFDRKIMLINPDGQVGEIQIWPHAMYDAKIEKGGQDLYTLWRGKTLEKMNATEKKEVAKIAKKYGIEYDNTDELQGAAKEKSIELYGNALKDLDPSMREIVQKELFRIADEGGEDSDLAIKMLDIMSTGKSK